MGPRFAGYGGDSLRIRRSAAARLGLSGDVVVLFGSLAQSDGKFSAFGISLRRVFIHRSAVAARHGVRVAARLVDCVDCILFVPAEFSRVSERTDRQRGGRVCRDADGTVPVADLFRFGIRFVGIRSADRAGSIFGSCTAPGAEGACPSECVCTGADRCAEHHCRNMAAACGCEFRPCLFNIRSRRPDCR